MLSTNTLVKIAAGAGVFVVWAAYYDRKRRSHPNYRQKVTESRKRNQEKAKKKPSDNLLKRPPPTDTEGYERYFLELIHAGEDLIRQGDTDEGIEHLTHALAICTKPEQLLSVYSHTLPPQVFNALIMNLPKVQKEIHLRDQLEPLAQARQSESIFDELE